jgi:uncharacterized protein
MMDTVSVTELKQQTASILERVKSGESVEITEHGRSVARLVPAAPATGVPALDRLIAQGRAVPATAPEVIGDAMLRTLDAIHLATAHGLRTDVTAFVSYDKRLCESARAVGLPAESPA